MSKNIEQNKKKTLIIESSSESSENKPQSVRLPDSDIESESEQFGCDYNLEEESKQLNCSDENFYTNKCNKFVLKKELVERKCLNESPDENSFLYPNLNDSKFNIKIAEKKEFNDTKYDGEIHTNIKEYADMLANAEFELSPHQAFVKNFMSSQTPYNSLLLYHGLGSGKTCSAIGVSEEMRDYLKQMGMSRRIIIVASENVQDNFKLQLFDERKLKLVDGLWNIKSCIGNKLLKEINPMNMKGITKEKVISQIKTIINNSYLFLGYGQFANYIIKTIHYDEEEDNTIPQFEKGDKSKIQMLKNVKFTLNKQIIKRLRNEFDNRLIIIDEVHNIRKADDNENKKVAINLELLVKVAKNMRLLFLSATPMYNSYKEIIWLLNVMNMNDRRGKIEVKDVFNNVGNFKKNGEELLIRKATGYVSFVRGENPYTFPYRVYPDLFDINKTFLKNQYPKYQMNGKKIKEEDKKRIISLYLNTISDCKSCGNCQGCSYKYIIHNLRNKSFNITTKKGITREMPDFENMESFGYTLLQIPLESLIISYPIEGLNKIMKKIPENNYSEELEDNTASQSTENEADKGEEDKEPTISNVTLVDESAQEGEDVESNRTLLSEDVESNKTLLDDSSVKKGGVNTPSSSSYSSSSESSSSDQEIYIDPKDLTGRKGLERMMRFTDSKSPPEKGSFEYKQTTIDKYGKIFSTDIIGKYSSKIKCVLDQIISPESGKVSEGIILIYSQYIDSGLIPMALALEELGFVRFGENTKPLFKTPPSSIVDVKTLKPPANKKNFMPARYSMITGDPRISPNNDFEVKGLTNENNKDGHKVKVVLISKAGSEGIDLKFIRQVHILEPWYNMNRIDQITGRAVRNFSHKDLPFEKRNVQIFMYGTILENKKEEAADLYVYRCAEYKAIQIGKVSRVLKETAVDCIINHDQTNFTQELMNSNLKSTEITQELSTGDVINNFKIGDAPFSAACDYMETCDYSCRPDKKIDEENLNEDTYNEKFIMVNLDKILQKIKLLMKISFFYKKETLIDLIQRPKKYPFVQIYAALTQLIEDSNEYITDKYGRTGYLVNIGDYYLFQPSELRYKNISIFDRSVPIDYKHDMTIFEINQDIVKPVIDKRNLIEDKEEINIQHKAFIDELIANFNMAIEFTKGPKVPRGDDDWYKHCGIVMKKMARENVSLENLLEFLVDHIIEVLLFSEKVNLMNYLYSLKNVKKNSFEWFAKKYFDRNNITTKNLSGILLYNLNHLKIMILNKNNSWIEAEPEDEREIIESKEAKQMLNIDKNNYNKIIGFIGYEKKNKYLIFKTKDIDSKRDTGARCDESGKIKTLEMLNKIIGENKYNKETTKVIKDSDGNVIQEAIGQTELCVLQEFTLRYYNLIKKDNKVWMLTPEMALFNKLYSINVK